MRNIAVILKEQADKDAVKNLVQSFGGHWRISPSKPDFDEGIVEKGEALVLLNYSHVMEYASDYEPEEIEFLRRYLGVDPGVSIAFAIRRNSASDALAREIAERIIQEWGGYLDTCEANLGGDDM